VWWAVQAYREKTKKQLCSIKTMTAVKVFHLAKNTKINGDSVNNQ
jgi:hypothetical protein